MVGLKEDDQPQIASPSGLLLFPNPAKDLINIHFNDHEQRFECQVIDYFGRIMMEGCVENGNGERSIDVSYLPEGIF